MASVMQVDTIKNAAGTGAPSLPNGITGNTGAGFAAAGAIGEVVTASASGVSNNSSAAFVTVASISLTAGRYLIMISVRNSGSGMNGFVAGVSTATNANTGLDLTTFNNAAESGALDANNRVSIALSYMESITSTQSRFLVVQPNSSVSCTAAGTITAVRAG